MIRIPSLPRQIPNPWDSRLEELRSNLRKKLAELHYAKAVHELKAHPAWIALVADLKNDRATALEALATLKMDSYQLGLEQGLLDGLSIIIRKADSVLTMEQIRKIEDEEIPELTDTIQRESMFTSKDIP